MRVIYRLLYTGNKTRRGDIVIKATGIDKLLHGFNLYKAHTSQYLAEEKKKECGAIVKQPGSIKAKTV